MRQAGRVGIAAATASAELQPCDARPTERTKISRIVNVFGGLRSDLMRRLVVIVVGLGLMLPAAEVWAWNSTGHLAVALLAWRKLSREEQAAAARVLRAHPHYDRYLTQDRPQGVPEGEWAFLRAATWPDWVRGGRGHADHDVREYHHAKWHYVNLPFVPPAEARFFGDAAREPAGPNVITALEASAAVVAARNSSPVDRAVSLCWVLHLVGDIHQPLHCAALIARRFPPPGGDEGGNLLAIRPHKHPERLHAYWDRLLGTSTHYRALDKLAQRIETAARGDRELVEQLQAHATVESWAQEGLQAASEYAYLNGRLPLVDYRLVERHDVPDSEVPVLPAGYSATARDLARHQAALAGERLAGMLTILPR
jgi:hypothetical protein